MPAAERYAFGEVTLDAGERRLVCRGRTISLPPKTFDLLVCLVRQAGHLVQKQVLLETLWPDTFVEEGILAVHVAALRKVLDDTRRSPRYIETVAGSGYRFVAPMTTAGPRQPRPTRADVHEWVGHGRSHLLAATRAGVSAAIDAYRAAIAADPEHAAAHAGLALACFLQAELRLAPHAEAYAEAKTAALRAMAMDDTSADAQVALGGALLLGEWDWRGAERALRRALDLNPDHTHGTLLYARWLDGRARFDEALALRQRLLERDPLSPAVHIAIATSYWHQRRYIDMIAWAAKALEIDPQHLLAREFLAGAYWKLGDLNRHMAENVKHAQSAGIAAELLAPLERAFAEHGRQGVVRMILAQAPSQPHGLPDFQAALLHGELGDLDAALMHLQRAIDRREPCLIDLAVAPQFDHLRVDPRFAQCLRQVGLEDVAPLTPSAR